MIRVLLLSSLMLITSISAHSEVTEEEFTALSFVMFFMFRGRSTSEPKVSR